MHKTALARPAVHIVSILTLLGAFLLTACSKRETRVEAGNRTQTIHLCNLGEVNDLDPQIADTHQTNWVISSFFEGLFQYDAKTSEPVSALAERWEASADGLTWTFHLRPAARWSNGDPLTARDFVFAYQRILSPRLGAEYAQMLYVLKNGEPFHQGKLTDPALLGVAARDDHTLVLTLEHPAPYLPTMLCHSSWFPLHRPSIEKSGPIDQRGGQWTRPGNLVSNGYFTLAEWKPNQYIRGVKSQTYWDRDNVKLNEVFWYPVDSQDGQDRAFRAGQLHVTADMSPVKILQYRKENSPHLQSYLMMATYLYRLNTTRPPLNDVRVRRALAMAIDRKGIVEDVMRGGQIPAGNFTPPGTGGFTAKAAVPYDLVEARRLLAEAGFPEGKGFPRLQLLYNTHDVHKVIAETVQQMWRRNLGIDIGITNQEAKVWHSSMTSLNYDIGRFAWVGDYLDPSTFLDIMTTGNGNNNTGWSNAEYDRLIEAAKNSPDQARRFEYFQRCEQILADEVPMAPVYFYFMNNLRQTSVKGWYGNILDNHPLKGVYLAP